MKKAIIMIPLATLLGLGLACQSPMAVTPYSFRPDGESNPEAPPMP